MNVRRPSDPLAAVGLGIATAANHILVGHPCMIFRRQCQVHQYAQKKHLTPFTLVPVACRIVANDGVLAMWKGSVGCGVLWALSHACELVIADVFGLPKSIVQDGSRERFWKHVLLKVATCFATTPFIISSFVETVRSSVGFSAEDTRLLDIVVQGFERLRLDFKSKDSSRRFTIAYLAVPTVGLHTAHFLVSKFAFDTIHAWCRRYVSRKLPSERTRFHAVMPEIFATTTSTLVADLVCYPVETVVHRLYVQGTRTLIDNMDNGMSALSLSTKYEGFFHCLRSIIDREGVWALYSGVGAIALQYLLQFCILRLLRTVFDLVPDRNTAIRHVKSSDGDPSSSAPAFKPHSGGGFEPYNPSAQFAASELFASAADGERDAANTNAPLFPTFAQTQKKEGSSAMLLPLGYSFPGVYSKQLSPPIPGNSSLGTDKAGGACLRRGGSSTMLFG